jgi:DNA-binding transcriptional regulator LsrR (DeoR family)
MELDDLRRIPHAIAVAVGAAKINGIVTAARAGYINELVTDLPTAPASAAGGRRARLR